jgi:GNAT superfamily N-acetyltransferase
MSDVRLQVRRAVMADAEAIARVHVAAWRAAYAGVVPDRYLVAMSQAGQARQWRRLLDPSRVRDTVLVAEAPLDGAREIVGFGSGGPARPCGLKYAGEVYTLYVAGDWQDRGIGRALLTGLFQALLGAGLPNALIWVLSANPARFFYQTVGGTAAANRQEAFAGTLLDETAYAWPDLAAWLAVAHGEGNVNSA